MLYPFLVFLGHTIQVPAMMIPWPPFHRRWDVRWKSCRARPWWVFINCSKRILGGEQRWKRKGEEIDGLSLNCVVLLIDVYIYIYICIYRGMFPTYHIYLSIYNIYIYTFLGYLFCSCIYAYVFCICFKITTRFRRVEFDPLPSGNY